MAHLNIVFLLLPALLAIYFAYSLHVPSPFATIPPALNNFARDRLNLDLNLQIPFHAPWHTDSGSADGHSSPPHVFRRKIVAVGDLHGDLPNAQRVLQMTRVVDENGDWTGDVDVFVQTGDIIDRSDDTIKLFKWMEQLRSQSHSIGGVVLSHLGNHEWMNVIGDWRYVYPSEMKTFGNVSARQDMLTTGEIGQSWLKNYTTASRVPLHPILGPINTDFPPPSSSITKPPSPLSHSALSFVHGGLAPMYPSLSPYPSKINEIAHSLLLKLHARQPQPPPHPPNAYPGLPRGTTEEETRLYGVDGPLWFRGWALENEGTELCGKADEVMKLVGVKRLIMGHTPDFKNIVSRCEGKIIIIDTGISHAYGGVLSALSIEYSLTPLSSPDGYSDTVNQRWAEKEVVAAVYLDREEVLVVDEREIVGDFHEW